MRKQTMKHKALLVLAASGLYGMLAASLDAQTGPSHRFDIPFEFSVNGRTMPAAQYTVVPDGRSGLVHLQSGDGRESLFAMTYNAGLSATTGEAELTFRRYGEQYILKQISDGGGNPVRELCKSQGESEVVETASSRPAQTVTLTALRVSRQAAHQARSK
jgi:hypothetical protein